MSVLLFIHMNKVGGRSVRYILRSSYGARHCELEPDGFWAAPAFSSADLRWLRKLYPRLASVAGHRVSGYVDLGDSALELRYFTFLRDPVKLCASRWQAHVDKKKGKRTFEQWLEGERARNPQTLQLAGVPDAGEAIRNLELKEVFVGLTENFDESLVLLKALRASDLDIAYERVNVAKRTVVAEELLADPKRRQAIVEANQADLELFEYARHEVFPRQQREFGPTLGSAVEAFLLEKQRGFNRRRITVSRAKQYGLYKPLTRARNHWTRTRQSQEPVLESSP